MNDDPDARTPPSDEAVRFEVPIIDLDDPEQDDDEIVRAVERLICR